MAANASDKGRPGPREPHWRAVVRECRRSGLTIAEFCRRRGINAGTFAWWKQELKRRDHLRRRTTRARFVPVRVVGPTSAASPADLEIELRNGRRLRVCSDVDAGVLRRVLDVLEEPRC